MPQYVDVPADTGLDAAVLVLGIVVGALPR